jgi:predicted RNA methylase
MREQATLFGEPAYDAELAQWHTPPRLAARMCTEWPHLLNGRSVLEPSAGGGALVRAALDAGAAHVLAVEIDPRWCERLRQRFAQEILEGRLTIVERDFLTPRTLTLAADIAVSNPPYDGGLDTAFLEACARVPLHIAVTNASALAGADRHERVWSRTRLHALRVLSRRPAWNGTGGGSKDVVVTLSGRGDPGAVGAAVDWWPEAWA